MKKFSEFFETSISSIVNERFLNLIGNDPRKDEYKDEIYSILQKSYAPIGGLSGSGFKDADNMKDIELWKIFKHNGKVVGVKMYKDKDGRKSVASGTDGSKEGIEKMILSMKEDLMLARTWCEISGKALSIAKKSVGGDVVKYAIDFDTVKEKLTKLGYEIKKPNENDEAFKWFPELKDYFYQRKIGGSWHTKVSIGNPNASSITVL